MLEFCCLALMPAFSKASLIAGVQNRINSQLSALMERIRIENKRQAKVSNFI